MIPLSVVIDARIDLRKLASLVEYYDIEVKTRSALMNQIVNDLYMILLTNNLVTEIPSVADATEIMYKRFGTLSQRSRSKIARAIEAEEISLPSPLSEVLEEHKRINKPES